MYLFLENVIPTQHRLGGLKQQTFTLLQFRKPVFWRQIFSNADSIWKPLGVICAIFVSLLSNDRWFLAFLVFLGLRFQSLCVDMTLPPVYLCACSFPHPPPLRRVPITGFRACLNPEWCHLKIHTFFTSVETLFPNIVTFWGSKWTYILTGLNVTHYRWYGCL